MEWKDAVLMLAKQVDEWVGDPAITVTPLEPQVGEPVFIASLPSGTKIFLEPAYFAQDVLPTVIELYAYPSMRRVRLVGPTGDAWEVQSSQGVPMNYKWNAHDFQRLLVNLADEPFANSV